MTAPVLHSSTMKAVVQDAYGGPESLRLADVARPEVGDDDVLVEVHAAGVDAGVWHLLAGRPSIVRLLGFGLRRPRVPVCGRDLAGRVAAVGATVTRFRVGDEVFGTALSGTFAEFAVANQDRLERKPANLSFAQAAAVPVSACAALHGLRDSGRLRAGQSVLVLGAGGGVGTFAVQLARSFGATVTGVCGTARVELVRSVGAERVIDRTREDVTAGTQRYDLILDTAGHTPLSRLRRILAPSGTLVLVGGEGGGRWLGGFDRTLRAALLSPFLRQSLRGLMSSEGAADLRDLRTLIEAGEVAPVVDRSYPLGEVAEAVRYLHAGEARGKVVIAVVPALTS